MRLPRPIASQIITFQLIGRQDVDIDRINQQLSGKMSASTRPPVAQADVEVVVRTGSSILRDEEFQEANRAVRSATLNTHEVEGWRVEIA